MKHVFKKLLCTVLLLLTLTACSPVKEENSVAENSTLSKTQHSVVEYSDPYAARQTERVRFRVNDSMPSYEEPGVVPAWQTRGPCAVLGAVSFLMAQLCSPLGDFSL